MCGFAGRGSEGGAGCGAAGGKRSECHGGAAEPGFLGGELFGDGQCSVYGDSRGVGKYFPGTPVVPHITSGYTENQRYRPLGIVSYGFNPYAATDEEGNTEHGNDERIRVEEVRRGPRVLFDVVVRVAGE